MSVAHQRVIREQVADLEAGENLFGDYWAALNLDIRNATVRQVSRKTAETIILKYEWLRSMPAVVWFCFGIFFDEVCAGVVVYGPEYIENLGRWDPYDYTGRIILLSRGACVHWAPAHSASKLIRASMKLLPKRFEVVTATTDPGAGEIGTIYQACGFDYVGQMGKTTRPWREPRRSFMVGGRIVGERSIRALYGTRDIARLAQLAPHIEPLDQHYKHRYFAFRGSPATKARNRAAIANIVKPYPKRAVGVEVTSLAFQPSSGGSIPSRRSESEEQ